MGHHPWVHQRHAFDLVIDHGRIYLRSPPSRESSISNIMTTILIAPSVPAAGPSGDPHPKIAITAMQAISRTVHRLNHTAMMLRSEGSLCLAN